jgi:oligopeptide/dipeptide ABC transporter ATP-binding protein
MQQVDTTAGVADGAPAILAVRDLRKVYALQRGWLNRRHAEIRAVDGVSIEVRRGETLAIVGESGCGKSTLARLMLRMEEPTSGEIRFEDQDLLALSGADLRRARTNFQMVYQDPYSSLNPRMRIGQVLAEALLVHDICKRQEVQEYVLQLLRQVELSPVVATRYPAHLSGGQRQRAVIARALAVQPRIIVADEPVSALDVSVQAQILNLMQDLKRNLKVTWVFISHNLAVVRQVADRVVVMYLGRIVEEARVDQIFMRPLHPYTKALLSSVPEPEPRRIMAVPPVLGDPPAPTEIPPGCRFQQRCPLARPFCRTHDPALAALETGHRVACWAVSAPDRWERQDG